MRQLPEFERMLVALGIILRQVLVLGQRRGAGAALPGTRIATRQRWKLSPMDLESRERWVDYSRAKDEMFRTPTSHEAPWYVVEADDKRRARLNCISHLLDTIPYEDVLPEPIELPARPSRRTTGAAARRAH